MALCALLGACITCSTVSAHAGATLRSTYNGMAETLAHSAFQRPLALTSTQLPEGLRGDVYAVLDEPLDAINAAFEGSAHWCEVLLLHINNRRCEVAQGADGAHLLKLGVVRNFDQPVEQGFELTFVYRVVSATADDREVLLTADSGPLGTRNYRIVLDTLRLDDRRTFLHFSYSYEQNMVARLAVAAYLATFGSSKVGFTVVGKQADGQPQYIAGARGLVERNAMRYFLALDAYLAAASLPPNQRLDARLQAWFTATERYPRQLHEIDRATYLALKRSDARQRH